MHKLFLYYLILSICFFAFTSGKAQENLSQLEKQLPKLKGKAKITLLNQLSTAYENAQPLKANAFAQQALELAQNRGDQEGQATALKNLGNIYLLQSNLSQALDNFLKSLQLYEKINNPAGIAQTLNNIGIVYHTLQDYKQAKKYYERVLKIDEITGDEKGQASTLNNIGDIYYQQKEYNEAYQYYDQSLKIRRKLKDQGGIATSLKNIGLIYFQTNRYEQSLGFFKESLKIDEDLDNQANISATLYNIADSYLKMGKLDTALNYALQSLEIAEALDLKKLEAEASNTVADIYYTLKDFEKAYEFQLEHVIMQDELYSEVNKKKVAELQNSYELDTKQKEINLLNKKKEIRQILIWALTAGLFLVSVIVFVLLRSNRQKKITNQILLQQNEEINQQNEEILAISNALEEQKNKIAKQRDEIAIKNQNIQSSIHYAKRIQEAMLPYEEVIDQELPLHFIYYVPRDVVSGDFYWYTKVDSIPIFEDVPELNIAQKILTGFENEKVIIAAVDCTGHGIPGAFMSMIGDSLLNQIVLDKGITEADIILNEMHKGIRTALKQEESHNPDGMDMALCVIDKISKTIEFAGAKNSLLYIQDKKLKEIKANVLSVGGWVSKEEKERYYTKHTISYAEQPITLYLYSDGYQDQFGGPQNRKFMRRRFKELLFDIYQEPMTYQKDILDKTLKEWMGNEKQMDDILVIGIRLA